MKQIVHAKWTKSNGARAANMSQEELTAEAEKILKKSQSKNLCNPKRIHSKLFSFSENKVAGQTTEYVNRMIAKYN